MYVKNLDRFIRALAAVRKNTPDVLTAVAKVSAMDLEARVLKNIYVRRWYGRVLADTGYMGKNTFWKLRKTKKNVVANIYTNTNYAAAVEHGARPHKPPFKAIEVWVNNKLGIRGKQGKEVAAAIVRKIQKKGIRPRPFFGEATESFNRDMAKILDQIRDKLRGIMRYGKL